MIVALISAAAITLGAIFLTYLFQPAIQAHKAANGVGVAVTEEVLVATKMPESSGGKPEGVLNGGKAQGMTQNHQSLPSKRPPLLSLIIPAYNEKERLPIMLGSTLDFLRTSQDKVFDLCKSSLHGGEGANSGGQPYFEVVIVDDGSTDDTGNVVRRYFKARIADEGDDIPMVVRLVTLGQNSGKGAAVKTGMIRSEGSFHLMVDADGATDFGDGIVKLLTTMGRIAKGGGGSEESAAAIFGSRAHLESTKAVAKRSPIRVFLMKAFHFFVSALCSSSIRDTQCGFKLFNRTAAIRLFANLHLRRWAFDTELVVLAEKSGVKLAEVGVNWHEVDGSKLDAGGKLGLALTSLGMLRDMICVRICYALGIWKLQR